MPANVREKQRARKDAAKTLAQKIADVIERQLESDDWTVASLGRLWTFRFNGREYDVGMKLTFHRKPE